MYIDLYIYLYILIYSDIPGRMSVNGFVCTANLYLKKNGLRWY